MNEPRGTPSPLLDDRPDELPVTCPICGTTHWPEDPVLCRTCGEPVLLGGWAP